MKKTKREIVLMLCNIRSVYNVGAIFRTADAIGVTKIILGGYTPAPVDRFGRKRNDLAKAALGAEYSVPWTTEKNFKKFIKQAKEVDFYVVAVEQAAGSIDYKKFKLPENKRVLIILGNETRGLGKSALKYADCVVEIPMRGKKESLNVSVAAGIILFRLLDFS
jgi:23S rRNA (guanosine2251-2'-O)-methyltransferase